jgi:putative endonuclease
VKAVKAKK